MKNLSVLSNTLLHEETMGAATHEKSATLQLLEYLSEIDRRRLYAAMGYSSLWMYVNQALGYSESQTSERISAMRLMVKIPQVKEELSAGKISLTSTAKLAAHIRREKTDASEALVLLTSVAGKSSREVDRILASESKETIKRDQVRVITPETARITIDVDQEFLELMNRVRELKGHFGSATQDLLKITMQDFIQRREPKQPKKSTVDQQASATDEWNENPALEGSSLQASEEKSATSNSRYIPEEIKNTIRLRSGDRCEYVDPNTKHRCHCKTRLEFDHIIPFMLGGQNTVENLRHFCRTHNQLSAIRNFGVLHMNSFLKN